MEKIDQISYKFFGRRLDDSFSNVIITNIRPMYIEVVKGAEIINQSKGFYECSLINLNSKKYLIIKISPGNVIIDVLKIISSVVDNIFLIGLAGALNNRHSIGDIICPGAVVSLENLNKKITFNDNAKDDGLIYQTDGLVQDDDFYLNLIDKGVDFVDMESFFLASFCNKKNIRANIIAIISDTPLKHAFYKNNVFLEECFEKTVDNLINYFL
ncbi:MAG: hypothetical protein PHR57_00440 [Patescibacteria group bacterium]|nr:hypothetical protein [Patescibacteria group bacterium]